MIRLHRAILCGLPLVAVLWSASFEQPGHARSAGQRTVDRQVQDPTAPFPRKGRYLGKLRCRDCHEDEWDAVSSGHHRPVVHEQGTLGCETCHGPGQAHGEDDDNDPQLITHPPSLGAAAQIRICVSCHAEQIAGHGGEPSGFLAAGKGCTSCHAVHEEIPPTPHQGTRFTRRLDTVRHAEPVGATRCVSCHPLRDQLLQLGHHASLAAEVDPSGCEACHGAGSLHVETTGLGRLITRPDAATDGVATCRSCHQSIHSTEFHWLGRRNPLLSTGLTCTSCHTVHEPVWTPSTAERRGAIDRDTGQYLAPAPPATNQLCYGCHAPAFDVLPGTVHASLGRRDAPLAVGCGSCHAGAEDHARASGRADLVDSMRGTGAEHQRQTCGSCHSDQGGHSRIGSHHRNQVTCLTCHSPAAAANDVRGDAERRCASCHETVAAEFRQPNRHPVPEGHMGCSDCHDPHTARHRIRDRRLQEKSCVGCHREYRGPFVFAHQASRVGGCVVCHEPHGSSNRRMLEQATTQQNCLQCHADFPSFHDQTTGAVFTNCLNCHTEVHGSNHSRYLFR